MGAFLGSVLCCVCFLPFDHLDKVRSGSSIRPNLPIVLPQLAYTAASYSLRPKAWHSTEGALTKATDSSICFRFWGSIGLNLGLDCWSCLYFCGHSGELIELAYVFWGD